MSVIAYFTTPADDFIFRDVLDSQPNVRIRLETMVPTGSTLIPYCWISGEDVSVIEATLEDSPFIRSQGARVYRASGRGRGPNRDLLQPHRERRIAQTRLQGDRALGRRVAVMARQLRSA